jgi:hypothetical protein
VFYQDCYETGTVCGGWCHAKKLGIPKKIREGATFFTIVGQEDGCSHNQVSLHLSPFSVLRHYRMEGLSDSDDDFII